jgi:acyl-CoA thioester hydrolase
VDGFPHVTREHVRFSDCDPMGHANNASYSSYVEQARFAFLGGQDTFILARIEIDFRDQLSIGEELEIGTRCTRVGSKSFEIEHEIRGGDGRLAAEAKAVLVYYDYEAGASAPIPDELRGRLEGAV